MLFSLRFNQWFTKHPNMKVDGIAHGPRRPFYLYNQGVPSNDSSRESRFLLRQVERWLFRGDVVTLCCPHATTRIEVPCLKIDVFLQTAHILLFVSPDYCWGSVWACVLV